MSDDTKTAAIPETETLDSLLEELPNLKAAIEKDPAIKAMAQSLIEKGSPMIQGLAQELVMGLDKMLPLKGQPPGIGMLTHAAAALAAANFLGAMARIILEGQKQMTPDLGDDFVCLGAGVAADRMIKIANEAKQEATAVVGKAAAKKAAQDASTMDPDLAAAIFGSGNRSGPALA
jgi:hypothetical protein